MKLLHGKRAKRALVAGAAALVLGGLGWAFLGRKTTGAVKPAHPVADANPTLREGDTGDAVRTAQLAVGAQVDGVFGPATATAVRAYQQAHALVADGVVGPATWEAINADA